MLFKMATKHSAAGLPSVPKHKKTVMCLTEEIRVLGKLCSALNYNFEAVNSMLINEQYQIKCV